MPARAKVRQWAAVARLGPGRARRSSSGPHFARGAGAPPEVPGGGTMFGSPVLGAGFSMVGPTSFGWMTPFDRFSFSHRFSPGAESSDAAGVGSDLPGAWANTEPATMVTPATNRQSREPIFYHASLKLVDVRSVPWGLDCGLLFRQKRTSETSFRRPLIGCSRASARVLLAVDAVRPFSSGDDRLCRRRAPSQASITNLLRNLKTAKAVSIDDRPPNVS